ncbi:MAG: DEAD/DEAH box helicase, partial [Alteromonadaceae bacterium]|nr:DEAD/DEAH box helicase [Alteromonadaceae bacterium]
MTFSDLGLCPETLVALTRQGYTEPTPVQEQAIPLILAGKDVKAAAQTGTGKTAGFTLPILDILKSNERAKANTARVLILTPTRELAAQVGESVANLSAGLPLNYAVVFG